MVPNSALDVRGTPRSSIYVAAALFCEGAPASVKIRNISATGALVEGTGIPEAGARVQLVRGGLVADGVVAWASARRCGLKFAGCVDISKWRSATRNGEQQRVDEIVRLVKSGTVPLPVPSLGGVRDRETSYASADLSGDLGRISRVLERLGDELAGDPELVTVHPVALQSLEIAMQMLDAVDAIVLGRDPEAAARRLAGLRLSAAQSGR